MDARLIPEAEPARGGCLPLAVHTPAGRVNSVGEGGGGLKGEGLRGVWLGHPLLPGSPYGPRLIG